MDDLLKSITTRVDTVARSLVEGMQNANPYVLLVEKGNNCSLMKLPPMPGPETKDVYAKELRKQIIHAVRKHRLDVIATAFLCEAWLSTPEPDAPDMAPADDPRRQDVLMVFIETMTGSMCVIWPILPSDATPSGRELGKTPTINVIHDEDKSLTYFCRFDGLLDAARSTATRQLH